jgi:ABC-2 type transport system ATP-binding protein
VPPPALSVRRLSKRFGERLAVDDVSFTVAAGDIYGFLGPNGAGKTTTVRMLVGLVHPTAGEVRVLGEPLTARARGPLRRTGAIVEAPAFYPYLSGRDNLRMLADLTGPCPRSRLDAVLERVDLLDRAGDPVRIYSHGMKQRLAIAAALLPGPELILLDEPTNGLDPMGIRDVRALLQSLARDDGLTVFLSSHLLAEVEQVCNRGCLLVAGRARWEGEVASLLGERRRIRLVAEPAELVARVLADHFGLAAAPVEGLRRLPARGPRGPLAPAELIAALVGAGARVHEVASESPTLEEVFVEMVEAR